MKCKSCFNDVPPKFAHAISVNVCPLCGKEIMDQQLQSILNDLKNVMDKTKEYSDEVGDWLFSNYGLKKWDPKDAEDRNMRLPENTTPSAPRPHSKPNVIHRSEDIEADLPADAQLDPSIFAKRAGVKAGSFKDVIERIQNGSGAADISEFQGNDDEYGNFNGAEEENAAPLDLKGKREIMGIFKEDDAKSIELEKLKRLRSQTNIGPGGGAKFWRSS